MTGCPDQRENGAKSSIESCPSVEDRYKANFPFRAIAMGNTKMKEKDLKRYYMGVDCGKICGEIWGQA